MRLWREKIPDFATKHCGDLLKHADTNIAIARFNFRDRLPRDSGTSS